jgi:putative FmdB family regulatory protein
MGAEDVMPIYEYQCQACDHLLEALQKLSDAPLLDCPSCQAPQLKKKISAVGFRLKGSGWYETDFKNSAKKNVADEGAKAAPAETSTASAPAASTAGTGGAAAAE